MPTPTPSIVGAISPEFGRDGAGELVGASVGGFVGPGVFVGFSVGDAVAVAQTQLDSAVHDSFLHEPR